MSVIILKQAVTIFITYPINIVFIIAVCAILILCTAKGFKDYNKNAGNHAKINAKKVKENIE